MAQGDQQFVRKARASISAARIAQRVAHVEPDNNACIESDDAHPKEVQPLNAGFFVLEAMRRQRAPEAR